MHLYPIDGAAAGEEQRDAVGVSRRDVGAQVIVGVDP